MEDSSVPIGWSLRKFVISSFSTFVYS